MPFQVERGCLKTSFTYSSTNIGSSGLATVRFLIGDTSSGDILSTDEEINAVLTNITSNNYLAGALVLENLAGRYSRQADTRNEGIDVKASQRAQAFRTQAYTLRRQAQMGATIFAGGRSKQAKEDAKDDTDRIQSSFEKDQWDFPGTVASTTE